MFSDPHGPIEHFSRGRFVIAGTDPHGPIEHFSRGRFVIAATDHASPAGAGKDVRVVGREVAVWAERSGHRLEPSMITGVLDQALDVFVIGSGVYGRLSCPKKVIEEIQNHGVKRVIVERTPVACRTYNAMHRQGVAVGLQAHGTC